MRTSRTHVVHSMYVCTFGSPMYVLRKNTSINLSRHKAIVLYVALLCDDQKKYR